MRRFRDRGVTYDSHFYYAIDCPEKFFIVVIIHGRTIVLRVTPGENQP